MNKIYSRFGGFCVLFCFVLFFTDNVSSYQCRNRWSQGRRNVPGGQTPVQKASLLPSLSLLFLPPLPVVPSQPAEPRPTIDSFASTKCCLRGSCPFSSHDCHLCPFSLHFTTGITFTFWLPIRLHSHLASEDQIISLPTRDLSLVRSIYYIWEDTQVWES